MWNLKRCLTASKCSCARWAVQSFRARQRLIRIAKAAKRRANFAITTLFAGLIRGRTVIVCCARRRRKFFYELSELPQGLGLRQTSGALDEAPSVGKAVEGHRSPKRWRAGGYTLQFKVLVRI